MSNAIFVFGKNRSGTKWLSNLIANHSEVSCLQLASSSGILETNLFRNFPAVFGDLAHKENRLAFLACYTRTNAFKCSGLSERDLYEQRFESYFDFFGHVMGTAARRAGKAYWLQKGNSLELPQVTQHYPGAKFVIIRRGDARASIISNLALDIRDAPAEVRARKLSNSAVVQQTFSYYLHRKIEEKYDHLPNVKTVFFEDLKTRKREVLEEVCCFAGLTFEEEMLGEYFSQNSSFSKGIKRDTVVSSAQSRLIDALCPVLDALPLFALAFLFDAREAVALRRPSRRRFTPGTFRLYQEEVGW